MRTISPWCVGLATVFLAGAAMAESLANTKLSIENAVARPTLGERRISAAFLTVKNTGTSADTLLSASSPLVGKTEIHDHVKEGDVLKMVEVPSLEVPAGGTLELKSGGKHLMLYELTQPLTAGETLPLTLRFQHAGEVKLDVPVKPKEL